MAERCLAVAVCTGDGCVQRFEFVRSGKKNYVWKQNKVKIYTEIQEVGKIEEKHVAKIKRVCCVLSV
jgi:hypothetical protein